MSREYLSRAQLLIGNDDVRTIVFTADNQGMMLYKDNPDGPRTIPVNVDATLITADDVKWPIHICGAVVERSAIGFTFCDDKRPYNQFVLDLLNLAESLARLAREPGRPAPDAVLSPLLALATSLTNDAPQFGFTENTVEVDELVTDPEET